MRSTGNPVVVARDLGSCAHYLPHAPLVRRPVTGHPTNLRFAPGDARDAIVQGKLRASDALLLYTPPGNLLCTTATALVGLKQSNRREAASKKIGGQ